MLPAKYQPNRPSGSGEEDFWRVFTIFGHGGHLEFRIKSILSIFRSPSAWMLHMKFGYIWPSGFRGEVVWKCGRTTEAYHTISSLGAFGSGELKSCLKLFKYVIFRYMYFSLIRTMGRIYWKAACNGILFTIYRLMQGSNPGTARSISQPLTCWAIGAPLRRHKFFPFGGKRKGCRPSVPRCVKCQYVVTMSITCMLKKCHQRRWQIPSPPPPLKAPPLIKCSMGHF